MLSQTSNQDTRR